jgi:4-hydroxyphenylpyruvate dioxygenase
MGELFERMGFTAVARHRRKNVTLYRQGEINFIINAEPDSLALRAPARPSICAIAFRVADAKAAYERAIAWAPGAPAAGPGELNIPAIKGIGDSIIYFIDRWRGKAALRPRDRQHRLLRRRLRAAAGRARRRRHQPRGLWPDGHRPPDAQRAQGRMDEWAGFYERLFNFREVLLRHRGSGHRRREQGHDQPLRQDPHPDQRRGNERRARSRSTWTCTTARACSTSRWPQDIYHAVDQPGLAGVKLDTSDTYYELLPSASRPPEPIGELQSRNILVDGRQASCCCRSSARTSWADLLRVHPAQGQRRLRRGQLQGPVRDHGAGPDSPRRLKTGAWAFAGCALVAPVDAAAGACFTWAGGRFDAESAVGTRRGSPNASARQAAQPRP